MTTTIRIYFRYADGKIDDANMDFSVEDFAGFLPAVGDTILNPGVLQGLDRDAPENREIWTVVGRVFNPRDLANYVVLIVEERAGSEADGWL